MARIRRKSLIGTLILAATMVGALFAVQGDPTTARPAMPAVDWPAMTLVYRVEGKFRGIDGPTDSRVFRLNYQGLYHWQKEQIEDSADPSMVGSTDSFEGTTNTFSTGNSDQIHSIDDHEVPLAPEQWLVPGRDRWLVDKYGFTKRPGADANHVVYTLTETLDCVPSDPANPTTRIPQPASCATSPTYQNTEEIVYRVDLDLPIPVEVTNRVGTEITRHVEVTQLTVH